MRRIAVRKTTASLSIETPRVITAVSVLLRDLAGALNEAHHDAKTPHPGVSSSSLAHNHTIIECDCLNESSGYHSK